MSEILLTERRDDAVAILTLNRPERGNALSPALVEALGAALAVAASDGTRLLVLRGNGRHFCTGFDLTDLEAQSDGDLVLRILRVERLLQAIFHAPFHTMALAHGRVTGAGAEMLCACDTRIGAPGVRFAMPGPQFGVALGTRRLAHRIGAEKAAALLLQGHGLEEGEALAHGLLSAVAEPETWPSRMAELGAALGRVAADTAARLRAVLKPDTRAADLATLVESVIEPGLRERIARYRDGLKATAR
ncbi:MAG: enoyl-CoA hydratase/isomerase family protein [Dongiaceae bacterium]